MASASDAAHAMLGDPKKLKTPSGHGYLVGRRDRLRVGDDAAAIVDRILNDPHNVAALKRSLGKPAATMEELADWLCTGLSGGGLTLLRTRRKPHAMRRPPELDLHDLIDGSSLGGDTPEPEPTLTFIGVEVVDTLGQRPGSGELRFALGGHTSSHLASEGVRRGDLHPAAEAAAGCLELDFQGAAADSAPRPVPGPVDPNTPSPTSVTFEVISATGAPLALGYRATARGQELAVGRTTSETTILRLPVPAEPVQVELFP